MERRACKQPSANHGNKTGDETGKRIAVLWFAVKLSCVRMSCGEGNARICIIRMWCLKTPDCQGNVPKGGEMRTVRGVNESRLFRNDRKRDKTRGRRDGGTSTSCKIGTSAVQTFSFLRHCCKYLRIDSVQTIGENVVLHDIEFLSRY